MIDIQKTIDAYGYTPTHLEPKSNKHVVFVCDYCFAINTRQWNILQRGHKNITKDACSECTQKKIAEVCQAKYGSNSPGESSAVRQKIESVLRRRYGVSNPNQVPGSIDKAKQTNLARYGVDHPRKTNEVKQKASATCLDRYGAANPMQAESIREKSKLTCLERYGVENVLHSSSVSAKIKSTLLSRYGVETPFASPEIRERAKLTLIQRYGVDHNWKSIEVQARCRQTTFDLYGTYHPHTLVGKQEQEVRDYFSTLGLDMKPNIGFLGGSLELDGIDEKHQMAFEFCGLFWHNELSPTPRSKGYHKNKHDICRQNGIRLFTIYDTEWMTRGTQIKSFLRSAAHQYDTVYGARELHVRWTDDWSEIAGFCDQNHIQGHPPANSHIGAAVLSGTKDGPPLAVVSFGQHHRDSGSHTIVLTRLCYAAGVAVTGGLQRMLATSVRYLPTGRPIITWSDNRWTTGTSYRRAGFALDGELPADYCYYDLKNRVVVPKQACRKKVMGCPPEISERDWCVERGLARVWDCGKTRWKYNR